MADTGNIASALVAALAEVSAVTKSHRADAGSYSYEYADLGDIVALTRPKLAEHGLIAVQKVHDHQDGLAVTTTLLHSSGESLDFGPLPFPQGRDAQATGSAITYHRRYSLLAALGMATEDDDGAAASRSSRAAPSPAAGVTPEQLGEQIKHAISDAGVTDGNGDHAKAIWKQAAPKKAGDGLIYESEVARVLAVAGEYLTSVTKVEPGTAFDDPEEPF